MNEFNNYNDKIQINLKNVTRKCPICLNNKTELLYTHKFILPENYPLPNKFDVVKCDRCGFIYEDISAEQKDYDDYYENLSKYESDITSTGGGILESDAGRMRIMASDISRFINDKQSYILDIGCANGGLLNALKDLGYTNLIGMDPSPACVENVRAKGVYSIQGGLFTNALEKISGQYGGMDCTILANVLEHIYDLQGAIRNIADSLKAGGLLCVEVPDALKYADYYTVPFQYFNAEHINHFDENSLKNLILKFGFECIYAKEKEVTISEYDVYPVISLVFKKTENIDLDYNKKIIYNPDKEAILKYIAMSRTDDIWKVIDKYMISHQKIIVWGAGMYTSWLLENTNLGKCNIIAFVDNDLKKQGKKIRNIEIFSPSIILKHKVPVVVCSVYYGADIKNEIMKMDADNDVVILKKSI